MVAVLQTATAIMTSSIASTVPQWVDICGKLAPAAAVVVFMAPIPTIRQINRVGSVGNMPLLPYSSMIACTFLSIAYGVLKNEPKIWAPNSIGLVLGVCYFLNFIKHVPKASPTLPGSIQQHAQFIAAVVGTTLFLALSPLVRTPLTYIGTAGVVFCVAMFASPLSALKVVIQTKSAKSIPLPFSVASVINCFLWSVTGLLDMRDINVWLPNILGLTCSLMQVGLKLIYGDGPGPGKAVELPM